MRRNAWLCVVMAGAAFLTGCVERRYVIDSQPRGAAVFRNGVYIGATPVDEPFTYYGKYHYTLVLEVTLPNLATFESNAPRLFGDKEWQAQYQKMAPLVESGYREIFTIVEW